MRNRFNIIESEKNRIRGLHKDYSLIKEAAAGFPGECCDGGPTCVPVTFNSTSDDCSIFGMDECGHSDCMGDPAPGGDDPILHDDGSDLTHATNTTTSSNIPCSTIYNALQTSNALPYWNNAVANGMLPGICSKCNSHYNTWLNAGQPTTGTDWNGYGTSGQQVCLMLINNPQCCTSTPPTMWGCSQPSGCVQDPNGQFQTQADCQASGCGDVYCTDCQGGTMTLGTAGVCPQGYVLTPGTPGTTPPSPICYECVNGVCNGPGWTMGPNSFNSQGDCQNSQLCQPPSNDYECVNGGCVIQPGGQYTGPTAQADCQQNCPPPPNMWECDTNNGCSQTSTGTYNSQGQCETACCQDVINNWGWAQGSQSNPCQKFYNMFGAMGATNPSTLPFNEECIYHYLMNLILNLGGPCVSGNFINLLDNFLNGNNGCYGNPGSGGVQGNPSQNSICGKQAQFCNASPMTAGKFFKCQYAIDFATNNGCIC